MNVCCAIVTVFCHLKKKEEKDHYKKAEMQQHIYQKYIYIRNATAQLSEIYIYTGLNGQHA